MNMSYDNRLNTLFNILGCDGEISKSKASRQYKKLHAKYLSGLIDINESVLIESAYKEILDYYEGIEVQKKEERDARKKILLYETKKMNEEIRKQRELEEYKGSIWVFFENLRNMEIDFGFDDYIEYIKQSVLDNLDDSYREMYNEFLELFLKLWSKVYERIMIVEKNIIKKDRINDDFRLEFGEDELTDAYFKKNRAYFPYGKFSRLLELSHILSSLVPLEKENYFLDVHLSSMAKFFSLGYGVSYFSNTPIYSFVVNTRAIQFKQEYYEIFDSEVRSGVRKSPFVDNLELLSFVGKKIDDFNKEKKYELK